MLSGRGEGEALHGTYVRLIDEVWAESPGTQVLVENPY